MFLKDSANGDRSLQYRHNSGISGRIDSADVAHHQWIIHYWNLGLEWQPWSQRAWHGQAGAVFGRPKRKNIEDGCTKPAWPRGKNDLRMARYMLLHVFAGQLGGREKSVARESHMYGDRLTFEEFSHGFGLRRGRVEAGQSQHDCRRDYCSKTFAHVRAPIGRLVPASDNFDRKFNCLDNNCLGK